MKYFLTLTLFSVLLQENVKAEISKPNKLKAEVISSSQVKLNWVGSMDDFCYQVRVKLKNETAWTEYIVAAPSINRRINNLIPGASYNWEVQCCGKSKKEVSGYIKGDDFIPFTNCNAPQEISMVRSGLDYLIVNWDENGSSKYEVKIKDAINSEIKIYFTQNSTIRIDNLLPYTEYEISISSFCKDTDLTGSVFSEAETFSTYSFLQNDFERVAISDNNSAWPAIGTKPKMFASARLINALGQIISDIKPASTNHEGIYFDLNVNTPSGIYVVQIPGAESKRCLLQ